MVAPVKIKVSDPFKPLYSIPDDVDLIILMGGRGGMKTYEGSKWGTVMATVKRKRLAVVRDEAVTIRESILNEIFSRFDAANKYGHFDGVYEKIQTGIRNVETGNMQVFTRGFRASSNDKKANLKGFSEVDIAIIEEGEDIRSFSKFNTFRDSIRTKGRKIVVMLNTPDLQHWIIRRYFTPVAVPGHDGYFSLVPKKIPGFMAIQTTFLDNPFLPPEIVRDYKAYGDPASPTYDLHYYLTAICGYASSGRKGQVLRKVKPISLADFRLLPFKEIYGLDFGTSSPAGIVGAKFNGNNMYVRQLNYLPMSTYALMKFFALAGMSKTDLVIADSADPISIGKLRRGLKVEELEEQDRKQFPNGIPGLNVMGVVKGPGSVEAGLGLLTGMNLYFVEESADLWDETANYIYAVNKEGEPTNIPIDAFNHLIDPTRYIAQSRGRHF